MRFASGGQHATLFAAVIVFAASSIAYPQRPNADDIAAYNVEAQRAVSAGTASGDSLQPNTKDHSRAAEARTETIAQTAGGGTKSDEIERAIYESLTLHHYFSRVVSAHFSQPVAPGRHS